MPTLYGLSNCDSCRKARAWLQANSTAHEFHDFRKDGLSLNLLTRFESALGWEAMLNRRGTTWRGLSADEQSAVDRDKALALMLQYPALIKRPLFDSGRKVLLGFSPDLYAKSL